MYKTWMTLLCLKVRKHIKWEKKKLFFFSFFDHLWAVNHQLILLKRKACCRMKHFHVYKEEHILMANFGLSLNTCWSRPQKVLYFCFLFVVIMNSSSNVKKVFNLQNNIFLSWWCINFFQTKLSLKYLSFKECSPEPQPAQSQLMSPKLVALQGSEKEIWCHFKNLKTFFC